MWTCVKCRQSVDDQYAVCPYCGAARSAGRFSRGVQPGQTPKAQYMPEPAPVRAGRGFIILGTVLALALTILWIVLAVTQHGVWADQLDGFLRPARAASETPSFLVRYVLYGALAVIGALIAALPGLWTVGLGKALRRLAKIEAGL